MKIVVNNQLINYSDEGKGDVVLLLHGWGASLQTFDAMTNNLVKNYRVVRLDFPAFGGSPRPTNSWSVGDYADNVIGFLDKIGIKKVAVVIAHSFGGRVTIKLAGEGKLKPGKIILIDSGGIRHSSSPRQRAYKLLAKTGKQVFRIPGLNKVGGAARKRLYQGAGAMDYFEVGDEMRETFIRIINEDVRDIAANIQHPTLIIWGEDDKETPVVDGEIFHDKISGSKFKIITHAGHFAYLDQPDEVMKEIESFLK
jgi:pimeloyl-ACP methyl ester carboxylesterase